MFATLARTLFGSANDRSLKAHQRRVPEINALEPAMQALDDAALAGKTAEFRTRIAAGASLDELLPEAFAVVREASRRVLGMRHFDVQMIGGMVLHSRPASPRCAPARARPWSARCRSTSTRCRARASTSSPSTTTWPAAMPMDGPGSTRSWA